ncbi:MAG: hypothetical protein EBZ51_08845 [Synechococcaceae bacterium WB9_2_112]|nr:hypothetical protein [Synechococcaceae bacterium WB9_2_112]
MIRDNGEKLREALELLIAQWAARPGMAGPHYCALPLLLHIPKGPASIVSVALPVVIDEISRTRSHRSVAKAIGTAIEREARGILLQDQRERTLELMRGKFSRPQIVDPRMLKTMGIVVGKWTAADRFEVGALLLDLVASATELIELRPIFRKGRRALEVRPTAAVQAVIKASNIRQLPPKRAPMLVPPRPWEGLEGGGHLCNKRPLVIHGRHLAGADLTVQRLVVNQLQRQQLRVDPWMVGIQRQAWDEGLPLFPVARNPPEVPPRPMNASGRELREWLSACNEAREDRRLHLAKRVRIHRALTAMDELAGQPVWFAYELDWRGRIYTAHREVTHQGPDWEKAALELPAKPAGETGFEWMLRAAAGHWGIRGTWNERLRWGRDNLALLTGAAEAPLQRMELWRDAKDPWQFLQLCRGVLSWLQDPASPIGCPIRLDQHASGLGILAALTQDAKLAAATRLTGRSPVDLYGLMAERTVKLLRMDLEAGPPHKQQMAAEWLEFGVNRSLLKAPTMTSVYGSGFWSCSDALSDLLLKRKPDLKPSDYEWQLVRPANYMARIIGQALKAELASCQAVRVWLRDVSYRVIKTQQEVMWTTPTGMPVVLGREMEARRRVPTAISGSRRWAATKATPGELSALATARGITANLIHSFDGAFCQRVICSAGEQGIELLTNHDCFGAAPAHAKALHQLLHQELTTFYATSWLPKVAEEIQARSGVELAPPPMVGSLEVRKIGSNPYAFS